MASVAVIAVQAPTDSVAITQVVPTVPPVAKSQNFLVESVEAMYINIQSRNGLTVIIFVVAHEVPLGADNSTIGGVVVTLKTVVGARSTGAISVRG